MKGEGGYGVKDAGRLVGGDKKGDRRGQWERAKGEDDRTTGLKSGPQDGRAAERQGGRMVRR